MKVHLFGAGSALACANFGLKRVADDVEDEFGKEAADFIRYDVYVDDGLTSVSNVEKAINLIKALQGNLCQGRTEATKNHVQQKGSSRIASSGRTG